MKGFVRYLILILVMVFILSNCKKNQVKFKIIYPEVRDGVSVFESRALFSDVRITGNWSIPKFKIKKGWVRWARFPGAGFNFIVPEKEKYIIKFRFENLSSLKFRINSQIFEVQKQQKSIGIEQEYIQKGWNSFFLPVQKSQEISVKRIEIFPERLTNLKRHTHPGRIFTPAHILYFLNPRLAEKIEVKFDTGKMNDIRATILIKTEKNESEMECRIGENPLVLVPIDDTIHKFLIRFPEVNNSVTLKSSVVFDKKSEKKINPLPKLKENLNVLIVLLDAARPDHFGVYGYQRNTTPNIDKLSKNALVFTNCYAEAAYTLASTGTLLTGLPPDYHGVLSKFLNKLDKKVITIAELFKSRGFFTGMISANAFAGKAYNYSKGFDACIELFDNQKLVLAEQFIKPFEEMVTNLKNKPFFIYLHLREPHSSYSMPRPFLGTFQNRYLKQTGKLHRESMSIFNHKSNRKEDVQLLTDLYDENLLYADSVVGKLMNILKKHRLFDQTIKIILSDHGEGLAEHGMIGHNIVLFREGIRIPLIVAIPGYTSGTGFIKKPAITSDLVITLSELYDLNYPYYDLTSGENLFNLPESRIRICRGTSFFNRFSIFMLEHFPYKLIFETPLHHQNMKIFNLHLDPYEENPLQGAFFIQEYLISHFKNFIRNKKNLRIKVSPPDLRKKDLKNLKSLGYIN